MPRTPRPTSSAVLALALATLPSCTLVLGNDYTYPDAGTSDVAPIDAPPGDAPRADAPPDAGECAVDGDCTNGPPGTRGRCAMASCTYECAAMRGDCDGSTTNGCEVDLSADRDHCGRCETVCAADHASASCASGECEYACSPGFADCETSAPDCETALGVSEACAGCGDVCGAGELCDTTGASSVCATRCDAPARICGTSCVDVASSLAHCGACDRPCAGANAAWACSSGTCEVSSCDMGFADCDGRDDNGCEISTNTSVDHCGGCGVACAPPRATGVCATGGCGIAACEAGYDDCNGTVDDGCEADLGSLAHCGGCRQRCDLANASETCAAGTCTLGTCAAGFEDCDGDASNGCEVALASDALHCGACGRACEAGASCVAGLCDPVREVAPGAIHTCALRESGVVSCWGANEAGQLGDGSIADRGSPLPITSALRFDRLASGGSFTCAIERGSAALWCWGRAGYGELGSGGRGNSPTPVRVVARAADAAAFGGRRFVEVVALASGACARDSTGEVWCWGRNVFGEVGDGSTAIADAAVRVAGIGGVQGLAAGANHVCARTATDVRCWGHNVFGQLGDGTNTSRTSPTTVATLGATTALSATSYATCAVEAGGEVSCWGRNDAAELGIGAMPSQNRPVRNGVVASRISCGGERCVALTAAGHVGWGARSNGELGDGSEGTALLTPAALPLPTSMRVTMGSIHACGVDGGRLFCWGGDFSGQLGVQNLTLRSAVPVASLGAPFTGVTTLAPGGFSTWIVAAGRLYGAGLNNTGILARGTPAASAIPLEVAGLSSPVRSVAAGRNFACAVSGADGARQVHCWGSGTGIAASIVPTLRTIAGGEPVAVAAGYDHVCAIVDEGGGRRVPYCWGANGSGQLGRGGTSAPDPTPSAVSGLTDVVELELGFGFSCARTSSGLVSCWGANGNGQIGDGSTTTRTAPTAVSGLASVVDLAVGTTHACAVRADGSVACWGQGGDGQLGRGTATGSAVPVDVTVLGGMLANAVAAGGRHTCALVGGTPYCWGANSDGQLGTGNRLPASGAVAVGGLLTAVAIGAARNSANEASHTCVLTSDGRAHCWGLGTSGRLGSGEDLTLSTPTPVLLSY